MLISAGLDVGRRNARLAVVSEAQSIPTIVPNPLGQRFTLALSIEEPKAEADPLNDQFWDKPKKSNTKEEEEGKSIHYIYGDAARRSLHRLKKSLQPHFVMNLINDAASLEGGGDTGNDEANGALEAATAFFCHLTTQAIHASGASAHPSSLRFVVSVPPNLSDIGTALLIQSIESGTQKFIEEIGFDSSPDVLNSSNHLSKRDKKQLVKEMLDTKRVLAVITDPVAIAHAHGLFDDDNSEKSRKWNNVLVVDWGASSLTLTHLQNLGSTGITSIQDTHSESKFCGVDILNILVSHTAEIFERSTRGAIPRGETLQNKKAKAKLEVACEDALRSFGYSTKVQVTIDGLIDGIDCQVEIMLARFEMLLSSMLRSAEGMIRDFVKSSGVDFDGVLCAGGVVRMKCVESMLNRVFQGKWRGKGIGDVAPEEAAALGSASFAHSLLSMNTISFSNDSVANLIEEDAIVSPVQISLSWNDEISSMYTMIERMTPLPALVTKTFPLTERSSTTLNIVQLSKSGEEKVIGRIEGVDNADASVEVTMELSGEGQLSVMINGGSPILI